MNYKDALKECRRKGTAHVSGDSLRAMYANTIAFHRGVTAEYIYECLQRFAANDAEIEELGRKLHREIHIIWNMMDAPETEKCGL